mmetsp:Transcript_19474/g.61947  ORF Transcript_19474/g.61947 Transcript_19474/m.61947 type:complete len:263 (+) Transcript_19474:1054-1842(+)
MRHWRRFVPHTRRSSGCLHTRTARRATSAAQLQCPSSAKPCGFTKCVCSIPRRRASSFIRDTNHAQLASVPHVSMAAAPARAPSTSDTIPTGGHAASSAAAGPAPSVMGANWGRDDDDSDDEDAQPRRRSRRPRPCQVDGMLRGAVAGRPSQPMVTSACAALSVHEAAMVDSDATLRSSPSAALPSAPMPALALTPGDAAHARPLGVPPRSVHWPAPRSRLIPTADAGRCCGVRNDHAGRSDDSPQNAEALGPGVRVVGDRG